GENLSKDDLVNLVRLRLDLVAVLQLTPEGEPKTIEYAHMVPPDPRREVDGPRLPPYRLVGPELVGRSSLDFGGLVRSLEEELARVRRLRLRDAKDGRAILVHVGDKTKQGAHARAEERLRELAELARTADVDVVDTVLQLRERIDPRQILGKGKLDEVVLRAAELDAETLVFDHELTPSQAQAIVRRTDLKVVDRTQLILDIFAQRAESSDGKLQVELAQLKYALPRLGQKDDALSRLTGGIGGRGPGETKLEIGRRRARERVSHLEAMLGKRGEERIERRKRRARRDIPIVSIVGYTNAGKSTLLRALTGADVLCEDKLFATLDTRSRRLRFPEEREVVITDTVGFIRDLPKDLFAAFRATFEEVADADLILHVVDASDPSMEQHIQTTEALLVELDLAEIPRLMVYNKADKLDPAAAKRMVLGREDSVTVSALDASSTLPLLDRIASRMTARWNEASTRFTAPAIEG
ncbi:MAG TPA: GTPase HflX, partial [Polyangiaceae bacterium]|nr:GTPase HflX [Polyangiaceae bacterium]